MCCKLSRSLASSCSFSLKMSLPYRWEGGRGIQFSNSYRGWSARRRPTLSLAKIDLNPSMGRYFLSNIIVHSSGPSRGAYEKNIVQVRQQFLPRLEISMSTFECVQTRRCCHWSRAIVSRRRRSIAEAGAADTLIASHSALRQRDARCRNGRGQQVRPVS